MKLNIEVDCTPAEARQFFGLPDVKPMQDAVMLKVQQQMLESVAAMSPDAVLKAWLPLMPQTAEQVQAMLSRFYASSFGAASRDER